jgi:uroporphyrin-III C-methyltransferase
MFVKLRGRTVLVVGAGAIAQGKIPGLLAAEARVLVVAPHATPQIAQWAGEGKLEWRRGEFSAADLDGASLAVAATAATGVNRQVFLACEARGILCNAVDDIENCHFYYGAVVQRGDLQLAISTNGKSPALAQRIRKELEETYGEDYAAWLDKLGNTRDALRRSPATRPKADRIPADHTTADHITADRTGTDHTGALGSGESSDLHSSPANGADQIKSILHRLASKEMFDRSRNRPSAAARGANPSVTPSPPQEPVAQGEALRPSLATIAKVYLLGAGPGDPDLLTQKAARLLQNAHVVLHDSLVSREVLDLIAPLAEIIDVGKRAGQKLLTQDEINSLLVSYAQQDKIVVRLKGGDPSIFGRAGEELDALRRANVAFEIVPGITAATAAAAAAGISLTDRRVASQVLLTTFSRGENGKQMDWGAVTSTTTLVLYMPGADYAEVSARLRDGGLPADLPCAIVSAASGARQMVRWSNISRLATEEKLPAPALLIVGRVAALRAHEISEHAWAALDESLPAPSSARWI